jgi:hypothetical protein
MQLWPRAPHGTRQDPKIWYDLWTKAVVGYSRRRLTVASDKLTAIQSIASEMESQLPRQGDYLPLSGMWFGDLASQLLWYVESGVPRAVPGRAPSWSWASLDAKIGFIKGSRSGNAPTPAVQIRTIPDREELCALFGSRTSISSMRRVNEQEWKRASFPYNIMGLDGQIFAHGILDLDNRDDILRFGTRLWYFHISNEQHPSGLIVSYPIHTEEELRSDALDLLSLSGAKRIGVATIFQTSGETIHSATFQYVRPGRTEICPFYLI